MKTHGASASTHHSRVSANQSSPQNGLVQCFSGLRARLTARVPLQHALPTRQNASVPRQNAVVQPQNASVQLSRRASACSRSRRACVHAHLVRRREPESFVDRPAGIGSVQARARKIVRAAPNENLRDQLMCEPLASMLRLCINVEDVRGRPAAWVLGRWVVLMHQYARAGHDVIAGFHEPRNILARDEFDSQTRARCGLYGRRITRLQLPMSMNMRTRCRAMTAASATVACRIR